VQDDRESEGNSWKMKTFTGTLASSSEELSATATSLEKALMIRMPR